MPVWSLHPPPPTVPAGSGQAQGQSEFEVLGGGGLIFFLFCFQLRPKWAGRQREAPLFRGVVLDSKAVSSAFQMEQRKCESPMPPDSSLSHSPGDQISKHLTHSS